MLTRYREDGEDDDLEDLSWQKGIPGTFGKESDKFGKALASGFGPGFLQRVAASKDGAGTGVIGAALMEDDEIKSFVRKYAGNSKVGGGGCGGGGGLGRSTLLYHITQRVFFFFLLRASVLFTEKINQSCNLAVFVFFCFLFFIPRMFPGVRARPVGGLLEDDPTGRAIRDSQRGVMDSS